MRSIKTKLFSLGMAASMLLALGGCAMSTPANVGSIGGVEIPAGVYLLAQYNSYNTASGLADLATGETANDVKTVLKAQCTGTINGEEASTYFPLGTAQYHINADVAYAFQLYVAVTNDIDYLADKAAEVLCETARVWADVGCFAECRGGKYCICSVTGPDEYNAIVDNNFYTNLMAQQNLYAAVKALETLKEQRPDAYQKLIEKIQLDPDEPALWKKTADAMYFAYDEKRQVYLQDDGFMLRKPWDDSRIPPEKRHLLYENYHPLFI